MLDEYADFCYDQIGGYVLEYTEYFEDLRPQLDKANIGASLPEYVSMTLFTGGAVFLFSLFIIGTLMALIMGLTGIVMGFTVSLILSVGSVMGFYLYTSIVISSRASQIRDTLPFAAMYMSTLSGTGTSTSEMFSILANQGEEYGEIAQEAEKISRDIETFGMDVSEALKRAADRTPSKDFKELMWGINHTLTSGGSLRAFLQERSRTLMSDYQRRVESFAEELSLLVEMYITVVIVGSIVFTSISAVISSFASFPPETIVLIQVLGIFIVLPLISGMFILMVRGMAPGGIR